MSLSLPFAPDVSIKLIGKLKARFPQLDVLDTHVIVYMQY
jgi:hypothetical protein